MGTQLDRVEFSKIQFSGICAQSKFHLRNTIISKVSFCFYSLSSFVVAISLHCLLCHPRAKSIIPSHPRDAKRTLKYGHLSQTQDCPEQMADKHFKLEAQNVLNQIMEIHCDSIFNEMKGDSLINSNSDKNE